MRGPLVAVLLFACSPTHATILNVVAVGTFSNSYDPLGILPFAPPAAGTVFTLNFTYDSETVDSLPGDPVAGVYDGAMSGITLLVGNLAIPALADNRVLILDRAESDVWQATSFSSVDSVYTYFGVQFINVAGNALSSDALIAPSFPFPPWNLALIDYVVSDRSSPDFSEWITLAEAHAFVQTVTVTPVPLPPTALLLVTSCFALAKFRLQVGCYWFR